MQIKSRKTISQQKVRKREEIAKPHRVKYNSFESNQLTKQLVKYENVVN